MSHPLNAEAICNAAAVMAGAAVGVDDGLRARVRNLVEGLNATTSFTAAEAEASSDQIRQILANRLRLAADRARLPAIAAEKITRPIFVIGYSRTGTTLLHSLLAEDPANQAPVWWQSHTPSPPPGEVPVSAYRIAQAGRELDRFLDAAPGLLTLHPYWDKGAYALIEDEEIFTLDFQNAYPSLLYNVPALTVLAKADEPRQAYEFQKMFLQQHQWNLPPRRWVLKGCQHQFDLAALFDVFPDAVCLWPHRDPVEVHVSTMAICAVLYGAIAKWSIDWRAFGAGYLQGARANIDGVLADPLINDPRIVHLRFKDVARDPVAAVRNAYARLDIPYTDSFEARMKAWLADPANRTDRYGRYAYDYAPFGLDPAQVSTLFADYSLRFELT